MRGNPLARWGTLPEVRYRTFTFSGEAYYRLPKARFHKLGTEALLKAARDPINELAVQKDAALIGQGYNIRYDIIPDVNTGIINFPWQLGLLREYGIPYKIWGPDFWTLGWGEGLSQPMTWEP